MLLLSPAKALLLLGPLVAAHAHHGPEDDSLLRRQVPPGTDTSMIPRPNLGFIPYGVDLRHCNTAGMVALTFDDGPSEYTAQLLDILAANNAKATFFVNGNNPGMGLITDPANGHRAVLQRMYKEGHQIGSHTYTHADLTMVTGKDRAMELIYNEMALIDILGFFPTYLRPPYTSCDGSCLYDLGAMGYHVVRVVVEPRVTSTKLRSQKKKKLTMCCRQTMMLTPRILRETTTLPSRCLRVTSLSATQDGRRSSVWLMTSTPSPSSHSHSG